MSTWDYRAWADRQWFCGTGENAPAPGMELVAKSFEDECRRAFEAAYRLGQERMRERCAEFLNDPMRVDRALNDWKPDEMKAPYLAAAIRALPVEE